MSKPLFTLTSLADWLVGGRPMQRLGFAFTDKVSGKPVFYWRDAFGREWMAEHRWAWFRVQCEPENSR